MNLFSEFFVTYMFKILKDTSILMIEKSNENRNFINF